MFSGIGGFEIPMQENGWECAGYSEIQLGGEVMSNRVDDFIKADLPALILCKYL